MLAFDYGTKNIGVAFGQAVTGTGNELPPLKARDGIPDWALIANLLTEWQPELLLVGLPLNMDGSDGEICKRARKFANRLHGRFGLPVEMVDERLTTREAKSLAQERGHSGHFASAPIDSIAARLIVESWFGESN